MLTAQEQADLYTVYATVFGDDPGVKDVQNGFNEETARLVESAVVASAGCNASMKDLVVGLLEGESILAKGWLKKGLKKFSKKLKDPGVSFNGYACMVTAKSKWRPVIIESAY
jgi:hypothetical protein